MRYRVLFFCLLLIFAAAQSGWCQTALEVSVRGVRGQLLENIMARLRINLYRENSQLSEREIRRLHETARQDIAAALAPYGYYSPEITAQLTQEGGGWQAIYAVSPGEPVRIRRLLIDIVGDGGELPELTSGARLPELKRGDILDQTLYEAGKKQLLRRARALGFLDAFYETSQIRINRGERAAEIELVLATGPRYLFGDTTSEQEIIEDELLKRFLPYEPGDYYSVRKLYDLQRDLYRTDYFGAVSVEGDTREPEGRYIPVSIRLEPLTNYNRYSFGAGYATDTRARIFFEWRNRLFNRKGHRVYSTLQVGELQSHSTATYKIPVLDPRFSNIGIGATWNREEWEDTISNLVSAGVGYEYTTPKRRFGLSVEMLNEDYRVGDTKGSNFLLMPGFQGSWAIADNVVNTKNGFQATLIVSGASEQLVSDASFLKARGDGKLILTPLDGWRLIGSGSAGAILVDTIEDIPPSLRFYAGGETSVRGYSYRTLGPVNSSGTVVGGRFLLTGGAELERRLTEYWRLSAFYDVGNAMDDLSVDLAHGVGVGAGVALPFGQIKLYLAYPLMDEGSSQYVFLSVGADL